MSKTKKTKKMTNEELLEEIKKELAKQRPIYIPYPQPCVPCPQPYNPYPWLQCPQPYKITWSGPFDPCAVSGSGTSGGNCLDYSTGGGGGSSLGMREVNK